MYGITCVQVLTSECFSKARCRYPISDGGRHDRLAVELGEHAQRAVRRRVRGPDVDRDQVAEDPRRFLSHVAQLAREALGLVVQPLLVLDEVVLAKRVSDEAVMAENALQVRMAREADAVHVEDLALEPVRALPVVVDRGDLGVLRRQRGLDAHALAARHRAQVVHDLEPVVLPAESEAVDARDVDEEVEAAALGGPEELDDGAHRRRADRGRRLAVLLVRGENISRKALREQLQNGTQWILSLEIPTPRNPAPLGVRACAICGTRSLL